MGPELFEKHQQAIRAAYANGLGDEPGAFLSGGLTIVERPEQNWGYTAYGVSFPMGTLMAVAPELVGFARANAPPEHRIALASSYLDLLRDEANRCGHSVDTHGASICWALARVPPDPFLPAGLRLEEVDRAWLNAEILKGRFENGAGPANGSDGRTSRNLYGVAVLDISDSPVAVAGVFDTYGLHEIGVDVAPRHQGLGLGAGVVAKAVRLILDRGGVPFYGCSTTNIRSQRTALTTGFLPVCADGSVS